MARRETVELATICVVIIVFVFALLIPLFLNVLQRSRAVSAFVQTVATVAIASLAFAVLHELLHAAAAKAFGSRVAVRRFSLGFQTLFLDPLPLREAALTYLAPLLATPVLLPLQLAGLPGVYAALWALMCAGDVVALLALLAEKPKAVVCTPEGRALALR